MSFEAINLINSKVNNLFKLHQERIDQDGAHKGRERSRSAAQILEQAPADMIDGEPRQRGDEVWRRRQKIECAGGIHAAKNGKEMGGGVRHSDLEPGVKKRHLEQIAENVVRVTGARGVAPTDSYKVSATYPDGYRTIVSFMIGGMDAKRKGERVANAILTKCERVLAMRGAPGFTAKDVEMIGTETTYGPHGRHADSREVVVKIAVTHPIKEALLFFASEIAQASTGMAPGLAGIFGGRPKPSDVVKLFSCLVKKTAVPVEIDLDGERRPVVMPAGSPAPLPTPLPAGPAATLKGDEVEVPLVKLAWGRSGDKGNSSNIGIIARKPEFLPYIRAAVNTATVRDWMAHVLDGDKSVITRYELPGLNAVNFLMTNALGGGGIASLRIDPQGKALAQQLLEIPVKVPASLLG